MKMDREKFLEKAIAAGKISVPGESVMIDGKRCQKGKTETVVRRKKIYEFQRYYREDGDIESLREAYRELMNYIAKRDHMPYKFY